MKSFKEFLTEETTDFNNALKIIKKECSEILKIYSKAQRFLFRGINSDEDFILNKQIRTDRRTIDTPKYVHDTINKATTDLGFKSHRGNSIFCSNKESVASDWGKAFIVFPKNGFEYLWFEKQPSTYMYDVWERAIDETAEKVSTDFVLNKLNLKKDFEMSFSMQADALKKLVSDKKVEKEYYKNYDASMTKMVKSYIPTDKNLEKCLTANKTYDVLISGPPYHAISVEFIDEIGDDLL